MKKSFLSLTACFFAGMIGATSVQAADVIVPGFLKFEAYANIPGGSPQDLLGDPSYPKSPAEIRYLSAFDTRLAYPDDTHASYGARITGFVTPLESGSYEFFLRSDDGGQLWLSTDDNPANLGLAPIAEEPTGCCNNFLETGSSQTSAPKALVAGKRYYVMALYKESVGGDFCKVAWRKAGDTTPAEQLSPIPAAYLSVSLPATGDVKITKQPANTTAAVNDYATFSVDITTTNSPLVVQWYKNGVVLPGVTGRVVSLGPLTPADNNAKIKALASIPGAFVTSAEATLTATPDVTPPRALAVFGTDTFDAITITFSEAVTAASAGTASNYTLEGGVTVSGAKVLSPTQVRLATSKQTVGAKYVLSLKNILDSAGVSIAADAKHSFTAFSLVRGGLKFEAYSGITGTAIQDLLDAPSQYPNKPDVVSFTSQFTSRPVYPDATHDNYGGRLSGWIVPPETANYEFFLRSDNAGQLYLSKDDKLETAALIAEETGRANQFLEPGDAVRQTSKPIALTAGQRYYIYALWKAGGGGDSFQRFDYCDVAWRKVSDPAFPVAQTLPYIPGTVLETYAAEGTFTPPTISLGSPAAGDSFDVGASVKLIANAAAATNKTIVKVEYFESNQKIGEAIRAPFALTLFDLR